jgi:hypothetical protein
MKKPIFDKDHKVIPETLTKESAPIFILFLDSEIQRHQEDIDQTEDLIKRIKERFEIE